MSAGIDCVADDQPHDPPTSRNTNRTTVFTAVPATVIVVTCSRDATRYSLATFSLSAGLPVCIGPTLLSADSQRGRCLAQPVPVERLGARGERDAERRVRVQVRELVRDVADAIAAGQGRDR